MEKSTFSDEYSVVSTLLKELRIAAGITQVQMAGLLNLTQSLFSKYERGEVRLDIIQLRTIVMQLGLTLPQFSEMLEERLKPSTKQAPQRKPPARRK